MSQTEQPDRIRRARWLGWIAAFLVVALFVSHSIWTSMTASRMNRKIEALQRAGEPILPMDFAVANVNASDNAGPDILAAARLIDWKDPRFSNYQKLDTFNDFTLPLRDNERAVLFDLSEAIQPALQRLDAARGKTRFEWDIDFTKPMVGMLTPEFGELRQLTGALVGQAVADHERQLHRNALDRLEQISLISRLADRHPTLIGHLISVSLEGHGARWMVRLAPDLRIGTGPNDASPEQIRRIIDRLMDEPSAQEALIFSLRGERMLEIDMVNSVLNGVPMANTVGIPGAGLHPAARYVIRPLYYRAGAQMIDNMNGIMEAAKEKSVPAAKAKMPLHRPSNSPLDAISNQLIPSLNRIIETHHRGMTERQFAAVALAVRWYAVDHNGRLPLTVQELVPTYLPSVPIDRFSAKLNPLGYKLTAEGPVVYSVGLDGKDDAGSELPLNPARLQRSLPGHEWEMQDRVQPLYRRPRPKPLTDEEAQAPTTGEAATAPVE